MSYIHLYGGTVTTAGTDGTVLSEAGTQTNPVTFTLNATINQVGTWVKTAIRCDTGYQTTSGVSTTIIPTGTTAVKWELAPDNAGVAGASAGLGGTLTIASQIVATNTIIWVRASAASAESPAKDQTVTLNITAQIETP